jgi:glycosyltransferase involved in cell wall biosynthesis
VPVSGGNMASSTGAVGEVVHIGYVGGDGGDTITTLELVAEQARRGWEATLVLPAYERVRKMAAPYADRPNLRLVHTPLIEFDTGGQDPRKVWEIYRRFRGPLYHLHTGDVAIPRMNLLLLEILRGPKVVASVHSAYPDMPVGSGRARYWAGAVRRRLSKVVSPSARGRQTQIAYGLPEEKTAFVYVGIDLSRFASGDGAQVRASLGISDDAPLIVSTARLHPQKRPGDAVAAFARVAADFPEARLALVGPGPLLEETRAAVAAVGLTARVHFAGFQTNIPDWLAASDVWLTTSDAENFSSSTLEAMAAGCAIVGTNCAGNDEIFADGVNALTAPVGDVTALAEGLRRALSDPELRARLAAGARASVAPYTLAAMADAFEKIYAEALRS